MGNTRYQLTDTNHDKIAAKLLFVSSSVYEGDWPSIQHTHYFTELFYVRGGSGKFIVEDKTFSVTQDDLVIINPNVEHTEVSLGTVPLEYVVLGVEGLCFSFNENADYTVFNYRNRRENLMFYFNSMVAEMEQKEKNYELVCQDLLEVLLVNVVRHAGFTFEVVPAQKTTRECGRAKRYIDSNYMEDITLDTLAEIAHLNKFYFVHAFTNCYGLSPINYLNDKRIRCSKELLQSTDHSIAEIAQLSGFSSQSYFAQSFKKTCGVTAGSYRKMMKRGQEAAG